MSPTEAKRDILLALTQLSLGRVLLSRVLLSRAYRRFTGQNKCNRSIAAEETKGVHDILFALPCLSKPVALSCYPLILLKSLNFHGNIYTRPSLGSHHVTHHNSN